MKEKLLIAGLLVQALLAGAAIAADQVGQVISLDGAAKVQGADGRTETLQLQSEVYLNDRIITEAGAKVQIMLADDAIIMIGESSEMTLDTYVYSPEVAEENETSIGLVKGVFRVITAKITDLNPKKFHVKSKLATIGIRGCELGFEVGADSQDIHIIRVPEKKEIVVDSAVGSGKTLHVFQQGVFVNVDANSGLYDRPLTADDVRRITRATTPTASAVRASTPATRKGPAKEDPALAKASAQREAAAGQEVNTGIDLSDADVAVDDTAADVDTLVVARAAVNSVVDASSSANAMPAERTQAQPVLEPVVAAVASPTLGSTSPEATTSETMIDEVVATESTTAQGREEPATETPSSDTPPRDDNGELLAVIIDILTGDPDTTYPVTGERITTTRGGGADWSWGTWEQTDQLSATETRTLFGAEVSGNELTAAEFQALATGPVLQTLTGNGIAAAGVTQGNQGALLTGSSAIDLRVGLGVGSTWNGSFDLANSAGDNLQFDATGTLNPSTGSLATSAQNYSLNAFGARHGQGSLTRNAVNGSLVGNGGQITGSIGTFDFEHGAAGPSVQGVFGADLAP